MHELREEISFSCLRLIVLWNKATQTSTEEFACTGLKLKQP